MFGISSDRLFDNSKSNSLIIPKLYSNGDLIKQGEIIGYAGSSGLSTGPHLHYEIIRNGEKINPSKFAKNTSNIYLEGDDLQGFKKEYNRIIQLMKDY